MVTPEQPVSSDPVAALKAIVAEVAGAEPPFSADSYLPPRLVHDAREAISRATDIADGLRKSVREYAAHEELLLAMLAASRAGNDALLVRVADLESRIRQTSAGEQK